MTHLIITSANSNTEHFLLNDWLKSLEANVSLSNIRIVVLDYGISSSARAELLKSQIQVVKCDTNGHVVNLRLRDTANYLILNKNRYDQVLMIDGGDIIFQSDISSLFDSDRTDIRIATQNMRINRWYITTHSSFKQEMKKEVLKVTIGKPVLNFGVVVGPTNKVIILCQNAYEMIQDKSRFLIDQMAVNYLLHRDGYKELDKKYNFMNSFYDISIVNVGGKMLFDDGELIPIVHNNGRRNIQRPFWNFGFGDNKNQINYISKIVSKSIICLRRMVSKYFVL